MTGTGTSASAKITIVEVVFEQSEMEELIKNCISQIDKVDPSKLMIGYYSKRLSLLEQYWTAFYTTHRRLLREPNIEEIDYYKDDVFSSVEEAYVDASTELEKRIKVLELAERQASNTSPPSRGSQSDLSQHIQLPKIELPKFDGDPLRWEGFRDLFRSLVHDVPSLSSVQKFIYLKSCLSDEAIEVIRNIPVTANNYAGAWEDLESRYGNSRIVSSICMRNLFSLKSIDKSTPGELKRLLDSFKQIIRTFTSLKKPVTSWDEFFVCILVQKLDKYTRMAWETSLADTKTVPSFEQLSDFLENRIHALESVQAADSLLHVRADCDKSNPARVNKQTSYGEKNKASIHVATAKGQKVIKCSFCSERHKISLCKKFASSNPAQKKEHLTKIRACLNCLSPSHSSEGCNSPGRCKTCDGHHHSSVHNALASVNFNSVTGAGLEFGKADIDRAETLDLACSQALSAGQPSSQAPIHSLATKSPVLLTTAKDCSAGVARSEVRLTLRTVRNSDFYIPFSALVLRKLTSHLPTSHITVREWPHLEGLRLADPEFMNPAEIDVLLGADVCGFLFLDGYRRGNLDEPVARQSPFGWILMGSTGGAPVCEATKVSVNNPARTFHICSSFSMDKLWAIEDDVSGGNIHSREETVLFTHHGENSWPHECANYDLQQFWATEELSSPPILTPEEMECETHFQKTHSRSQEGRYIVRFPFRLDPLNNLASNKSSAAALLLSNERKFARNENFRTKYLEFMREYSELGHMRRLNKNSGESGHFLPHHGIFKASDPGGKLRVVFNASFKTKSTHSLNDCLMTGPKLQPDLWMILTRWRLKRFVFTADIVKMYRQILVDPRDTVWQKILWRENPDDPPFEHALNTVTYGTSFAAYAALRVLIQLAKDLRSKFPLGAKAIDESAYVDDFYEGADTLEEALEIKRQLIEILAAAGFSLGTWASNVPELCPDSENRPVQLQMQGDSIATLGVSWNPGGDFFTLKVAPCLQSKAVNTKRGMLSEIARLFDPLGWFSPVLIRAKMLIQDSWLHGLDWDDPLPDGMKASWVGLKSSLGTLETVRIPRWVEFSREAGLEYEFHGFCDTSERAYTAVIYLKVIRGERFVKTSLLLSKTKVAPVKTLSVPRLELNGAFLLAQLVQRLRDGLNIGDFPVFAWTDSRVNLAWFSTHASKWTPFVATRVAQIQSIIPAKHWRYVGTRENPADAATRGISAEQLKSMTLWWYGPAWLSDPSHLYEPTAFGTTEVELKRKNVLTVGVATEIDLLARYSSLSNLLHTTALCLRFVNNVWYPSKRLSGFITTQELHYAMTQLVKISQHRYFLNELTALNSGKPVSSKSSILSLKPFVDGDGCLRVGGRLQESMLSYDEQHPILLHKECPLSELLVRDSHTKTMHGGPQLTRSHLLRKFWIVHNKVLIKSVTRKCVICARYSGRALSQVMGNLPRRRITASRPFFTAGVDFAGPVYLRTSKGRGQKSYKGYICLFVCFVTRAIHLEAVSDLTSQGFLAAFKRFISRRGICQTLTSDNGKNFVGADRELKDMFSAASKFYKESAALLASEGTDWIFIPPYTPHYGGIYEAGVKSTKHHLRRVVGESRLTFEEMSTVLCQIEACLNSRPLQEISNDPSDLTALTPGHFLIGQPLTVIPEPGFTDFDVKPVSRWRLLSQMRDHFWSRWRDEYLHTLQQRSKWRKEKPNVKLNTLVLIMDELSPPAKWHLGRIVELHPGKDGFVREVLVRTAKGVSKKYVTRLCPLPVEPDDG